MQVGTATVNNPHIVTHISVITTGGVVLCGVRVYHRLAHTGCGPLRTSYQEIMILGNTAVIVVHDHSKMFRVETHTITRSLILWKI